LPSKSIANIPNLLSFYRIAVVPVIAFFFFVADAGVAWMSPMTAIWINITLFFFACWSDYFDGVIARRTGQSTVFGQFIDHASDKIMIGGIMLLLIAFGRLTEYWIIPALIIYIREILVAGLREFLGQYNIAVPVSWMGKWKTAVQMFSSGFLIAGDYGDALIPHAHDIGLWSFLAAMVMTVVSGWDYLRAGLSTLRKLEKKA
jgi:cardiolipin synthase